MNNHFQKIMKMDIPVDILLQFYLSLNIQTTKLVQNAIFSNTCILE